MKIFISIASYQDPLLKATINSAFNNADSPENLIFGVCDQSNFPINVEDFSFGSQIKLEVIDPKASEVLVGQEKEFKNSTTMRTIISK